MLKVEKAGIVTAIDLGSEHGTQVGRIRRSRIRSRWPRATCCMLGALAGEGGLRRRAAGPPNDALRAGSASWRRQPAVAGGHGAKRGADGLRDEGAAGPVLPRARLAGTGKQRRGPLFNEPLPARGDAGRGREGPPGRAALGRHPHQRSALRRRRARHHRRRRRRNRFNVFSVAASAQLHPRAAAKGPNDARQRPGRRGLVVSERRLAQERRSSSRARASCARADGADARRRRSSSGCTTAPRSRSTTSRSSFATCGRRRRSASTRSKRPTSPSSRSRRSA